MTTDGGPGGRATAEALLVELVGRRVVGSPGGVAVCGVDGVLTFEQLHERAGLLAGRLVGLGVGRGSVVGVVMGRGVGLVVGLLGVLYAGAAYVPVDVGDPVVRRRERLVAAGVGVVVADDVAGVESVVAGLGIVVVGVDGGGGSVFVGRPGPLDLAYVMFTSGSTGGPKGVMVSHGAVASFLGWLARCHPLGPGDRVVLKTPFTFDVSVPELFWPLVCGATVVVAPPGVHREPVALAAFMGEFGVTHANFVPSMLDAFLELVPSVPAGLRHVFAAGEVLRPGTVERFRRRCGARLYNFYGPTESTVYASGFAVGERVPVGGVPIGGPVGEVRAYVLDGDLCPVPDGVVGGLFLGGPQLARGYVGQPGLTAGVFVPDPFGGGGGRLYWTGDLACVNGDGLLEFAGRVDDQVKIGGVRVDPGEIEGVLLGYSGVVGAVVTVAGDQRLVAHVVLADGVVVSGVELRRFVAGCLPALLVPAHVFVLGEFPLTSSGKIDRRALPMPEAESPTEYLAPRNAREELIAEVWRRELRCGPVGVDQDFLALGGNSLAAMRIAVRLAKDHGLKVSVAHVLQFRTVAALAATLGSTDDAPPAATPEEDRTRAVRSNVMSTLASAADASLVWFRRSGESTPLFCVHPGGGSAHWYQHLTDQLPASVPVAGFQHPGLLDPVDAACGTEHLAARYVDELRATRPSGPYRLFGWCGGAPIAWEMAIRLRRLGADVTLVLLDPMLQVAGLTVDGGENLRVLTACDTAYRRLAVETSPDRVASLRAEIAELLPMIVAEPHHAHLDDPDLDEVWPVAVRSWRRQIEARIPYRYAAYDGAVHLVASDELVGGFHEALAGLTFDDYVQRWRHLTSAEVTVRRVSGGNLTAMLPPHVSELAGHLVDIFPDEP